MEIINPQFGIVLVLFVSLIFINRLKDFLKAVSQDDYRKIVGGMIVLTLSSVLSLLHQKEFFAALPFISEKLFIDIIFWSANLSGMILVLSGVARWLPVYQKYLDAKYKNNNDGDIIRYVEQIARIESRLNVIIKNTVTKITDMYDLKAGVALLYSRKNKRFHQVSDSSGNLILDLKAATVSVDVKNYESGKVSALNDLINQLNVTSVSDLLAIPLEVEGKLCGLFVFEQKEEAPLNRSNIDNIKLIIDIIAQKVKTDCLVQSRQSKMSFEKEVAELGSRINFNSETRYSLALVFEYLAKKINHDFAMVSIFNRDSSQKEYSVSAQNRSVLINTNYPGKNNPSLAAYLKNYPGIVNISDLARETEIEVDSYLSKADMRSVLAMPVTLGKETIGAIVLASKENESFNANTLANLKALLPLIGMIAINEKSNQAITTRTSRQNQINRLIGKMSYNIKTDSINQYAARLIKDELDYTLVRILALEDNFLVTKALMLTDSERQTAPEDAALVLDLMPAHYSVLAKGEYLYIEQNSSNPISPAEQSQFFGEDLRRTLLYPIKQASQTVGVITLGDIDSSRKFDRTDLLYLEAIAGLLGVTWKKETVSAKSSNRLNNSINEVVYRNPETVAY